jgi:hypothetical protein
MARQIVCASVEVIEFDKLAVYVPALRVSTAQ